MEKILFINSTKTEFTILQGLFNKYQTKVITLPVKDVEKIVLDFQPQTILFEENVPIKIIKKIVNKYPFIPLSIIGELNDPVKLEKILDLGLNTIKIPATEKEIETIFSNIMWFSLSKPNLWQQEVELAGLEKRNKKFFLGIKIITTILFATILVVFITNIYNISLAKKVESKMFFEISLPYVTPSDITFLDNTYMVSDWSIKNIFKHDVSTDEILQMYVPEHKFGTITSYVYDKENYIFTSSNFVDKIYVYKYPDFDSPVKEILPLKDVAILAMNVYNNTLFILDNEKKLYSFKIQENFDTVLNASFTLKEFFPIDTFFYNNHIYFLDNKNLVYKLSYPDLKTVSIIRLSQYFGEDKHFVSLAMNDIWFYLLNDRDKKIYKISNKILL